MQRPFLSYRIKEVVLEVGNVMGNSYYDSEEESVRKTLAGEKNKLSQMTPGARIDYIFTYYKFHIIGTILVILAIIWGIHHAMTYVKDEFFGMVINSETVDYDRAEDIREYLGMDKHSGVRIQAGLYPDDTASAGGGTKLSILLNARECDFIFTDEAGLEYIRSFFEDYTTPAENIQDSPIHDYFGLDDNTIYMIRADFLGREDYNQAFDKMLEDIENGNLK